MHNIDKTLLYILVYSHLFVMLFKHTIWISFKGIVSLFPSWRGTKKPIVCYIIWLFLMSLDILVALTTCACLDKVHTRIYTVVLSVLCGCLFIKVLLTYIVERIIFNKFYTGDTPMTLHDFNNRLYFKHTKEILQSRECDDEIQKESDMLENDKEPEETYEEQAERLKSLLPSGVEWQDAPTSDKDNSGGEEDET